MNWITKKIVVSKLSSYFNNLNQDDIEISILTHHIIKLKNMSLKPEKIFSEDEFLIPTQCRVGYIEIEFDFSNETPLSLKITNANLVFKFNEEMKEEKPKDDFRVIKEYHKYLKMREEYGYKSFFERKKEQLKDWFVGLLAEKTSLFISDIEVAVEYPQHDKIHYIGFSLQNINMKSRTIINEQSVNQEEKFVQLIGLGMFVGIENEVNLIKKQGENRETWVLKRSINKLYFLKGCEVSFRLNLFNKIVEAEIENFVMNATPTALKQMMEFSRYLVPLLNRSRPRTRPGEGGKVRMGNGLMTEGTADWWKYLSLRVMELISKRRRYNILLNPSYRKYLYCLLLSFVYEDKHPEVAGLIYSFEVNRPILEILKARQYLIERIHSIQNPLVFQKKQNIGFIKLIGSFRKLGYLATKEIRFQDIEKSKRWNIENGRNYIKKLEIQNLFKFQVKVQCKKMSIVLCENNLLYDFVKLNKMQKMNQEESDLDTRNEYIRKVGGNFLKHALNELYEGFKKDQFEKEWNLKNIKSNPRAITILEINKISTEIETNSKIEILIDSVQMTDLNKIVHYPEVLVVKKISVLQTLVNREMRAASLDDQNAKVSVFIEQFSFTAQKPFIQKLIFLLGLVDLDIAASSTIVQFQKTMREALYENISKTHEKGQENQVSVNIRKFNLLFPCDYSTKGNILGLELMGTSIGLYKNIQFLEVFSIKLAMTNSFSWKDQKSFSLISQKEQPLKQSIIMNLGQIKVENKSVMDKRSKNSKQLGPNIVSITEIVIPLICIELSIKELFLLTYLITLWKSTHFTPLSSLYVKSPLKKRANHQYLSENQQILVNNVNQKMSFSILGIAISFVPIKKEKEQCLFWVFLDDFQLSITSRAFSSLLDIRLNEIYVENISNHFPMNRGILERFTSRLLREGDRRKKGRSNNDMESLNLLLEKDISGIVQNESFKMKNSEALGGISFAEDDPEEILNALEFRSLEKNYLTKKLILMNEGERFLKITISDQYNLQNHQQEEIIKVFINPVHFLFQVVFVRNLKMLIDFSFDFSTRKLQNFYDYMKDKGIIPLKSHKEQNQRLLSFAQQDSEEKQLLQDSNVIIDAKLSKYRRVSINLNKIILMIFHHNSIIYCFSVFDIKADIYQKFLYSDINVDIGSCYIVDTKPDSGKKQEIISLKGHNSSLKINIRNFDNMALISRHNCKSSIEVKVTGLQAVFLKKKVIELVDIVRYFIEELEQTSDEEPRIIVSNDKATFTQINRDKQREKEMEKEKEREREIRKGMDKAKNKSEYGVFFVVEIIDSTVHLMQNSVDSTHVVGVINNVVISNRPKQQHMVVVQQNNFKNQDEFEVCEGLDDQNQQFHSFEQNKNQQIQIPKTYIQVEQVNIYSEFDTHLLEPIVSANRVSLQIITSQALTIGLDIKKLQGILTQDQYTFIMRMLDENFDQTPNTLRPRGPLTDTLGMQIFVNVHGIYLELNTPVDSNLEVESEQLDVKVFMYENDQKEVKLGIGSIVVRSVIRNNRKVILRSFLPSSEMSEMSEISKNNAIEELKKYEIRNHFENHDIIKQNTRSEGAVDEKLNIKMSMIENRDKFYSKEYVEKDSRKDTNYRKLVRCLGRFCCSCCGKRGIKYKTGEEQVDEIRSNERLMPNKQLDLDIPLKHPKPSRLNPSMNKDQHIQDSRFILRRKSYPTNVFDSSQISPDFLSFYLKTQPSPSHQSVKKLKLSGIDINLQQQNALRSVLNFFSFPFNNPNTSIKQNRRYNRYPPNSMEIDLDNVRLVIGADMNDYSYNSIEVIVGLRFVMEDEGDVKYGPGEQRWNANACVNVNYCKGNSEKKYLPISLCKDAKFMYNKKIKVPYYKNVDQTYQKKEEIYVTGINNQIHFKFPLTELKFIKRIFKKVNESSSDGSVGNGKKEQGIQFYSVHEEMKVMIPEITLELQRGISRALVEVTLSNMYVEMEGTKSSRKQYQNKATAQGTILGNYVNMSTGNVQPFIEAWTFEAKLQELFKQSQLIKLIKLASKSEQDNQGINCLNINVTTSLLKNLKDAETRYKNQGVALDDCFYNLLDRRYYDIEIQEKNQDLLVKKYNFSHIDHRNFFGKKFIKSKNVKGSIKRNPKYWNLNLQNYVMFYSFLDQSVGRKLVHIRTPLSIYNICGSTIKLGFDVRKKNFVDKWDCVLKHHENYAIPENIYSYDYLVMVNLEKEDEGKFVSVLGLLKEYEEVEEFEEMADWHPLHERAFRLLEGNPKKYVSKLDTIIPSGNTILLASTIKIKYQLQKTGFYNQEEKAEDVFETQVLIVPPLVIKNELSMRMQMFINDQSIIIQPNSQKILIDLPLNLRNIEIYFKKVTSSKRFTIFQQKDPVSVYKIHISQGYNINMKCIRMSELSRYLVIYSNYIIKNFTLQNFEIFHKGSKVLLERSYWFFITQDEDKQVDTKFSEINFYKGTGQAHKFDPNLKKQGIKLKQAIDVNEAAPERIILDDEAQMLPGYEEKNEEDQKIRCKCCRKKKKIEVNSHVRVYEFVIWVKHHAYEISRTLCIYYKFEVLNNSEEEFTLYHEDVEVFTLEPGKRRYLFKYESESDRFRIGYVSRNKVRTFSRPFKIDSVQDFMVKTKQFPDKLYPYDKNHLFRVVISEQQDLFLIEFMSPPSKEEFSMYLENSTMHNVRIRETDQDFTLPPGQKIPFFWSNTNFKKQNKLLVEIEGHVEEFKMNNLDQIQQLVLEEVNNKKQAVTISYKKGFLKLSYKQFKGEFFCVCDVLKQIFIIFDQTNNEYRQLARIELLQAAYMNTNGKNIFIYLTDKNKMTILAPSEQQHGLWRQVINNSLTVRTFHKIMLRMESTATCRVLKLYELKGDETKTIKNVEYHVDIGSVAITLIDSKPKEILLLGCQKVKFTSSEEFRSNCSDNLVRVKKEIKLQFGKMKLNNNLEDTQNPVIQAGSKKTDNPYFEVKTVKTLYYNYNNEQMSNVALLENKEKHINHFDTLKIFLDETEIIIDNANYAEIKKVMEEINKMIELYSIHEGNKKAEKDIDIRRSPEFLKHAHEKELYFNQLCIEPMKIVLSANWTASSKDLETTTHLAILKAMPFGIDHAVIKLPKFDEHHINENSEVLIDKLKRHYTQDIVFQILKNAGSYDLLVPLKIIGGVGTGAKDIFYDPIYTLFIKKDIKSSSSKVLEGCFSLVTTIIMVLFKFIYVIFKLLAFLTFDSSYNIRRNALLRTTMKNPKFAIVHAGLWWLKLIPEVITGFYKRPKQEYRSLGVIGIPFGFFSACMGVLKPVIGIYDFLYCLWLGLVNMTDYQPEPMKFRTRPVRVFRNNLVRPYSRYQALAHQVMSRNKIQQIKNEFIQYAQEVYLKGKPVYIIITNYRFITSKQTYSYNSIKFYKIKQIYRVDRNLCISLNIADIVSCCLCLTRKKSDFIYSFDDLKKAEFVEDRLRDAISRNSQNPLQKSQILMEVPVGGKTGKSGRTSRK